MLARIPVSREQEDCCRRRSGVRSRPRRSKRLRKSKDLRLLAYLGTASLENRRAAGVCRDAHVASQWLETYWTETYPLVDEDAIAPAQRPELLRRSDGGHRRLAASAARRSRQHGTFGLRDMDIATEQLAAGDADARPDRGTDQCGLCGHAAGRSQERFSRASQSALAALQSIDAAMSAGAGPDAMPDFDPLSSLLVRMSQVLSAQLAMRPDANGAADRSADSVGGGGAVQWASIKSRQDAIRALDAVAEFFRRTEPSSPIPLFLERAKRLVSKDFLEVLADIAPEAVPQARAAGGLRDAGE